MIDWASEYTAAPVTVPVPDVAVFDANPQALAAADTGYTDGDHARAPSELVTTAAPVTVPVPDAAAFDADPQAVAAAIPANRDRKQYDESGNIQFDEDGRPILTAPAP